MTTNYQFLSESLELQEDINIKDVKRFALDVYTAVKSKGSTETSTIKKFKAKENKLNLLFKKSEHYNTYNSLMETISKKEPDMPENSRKLIALTATLKSIESKNPQDELEKLRAKFSKQGAYETSGKIALSLIGFMILVGLRIVMVQSQNPIISVGAVFLYLIVLMTAVRIIQS